MSRAVNAVVVGVAVFVLAVSGLWYVYVVAQKDGPSPASVETDWEESENGTVLVALVTVENTRRIDATLESVEIEARVNDVLLGNASSAPAERISKGDEATVRMELPLEADFPLDWWLSHVERKESSTFTVTGEAVLRVADKRSAVAIEHGTSWDTELVVSLNEDAGNCPQPSGPCARESRHEWAKDEAGDLVLRSFIRVENPTDQTLLLGPRRVAMGWNGVTVAEAEEDHELRLDPGASAVVDFVLTLGNESLAAWWPKHVEACEQSATGLLVQLQYAPEEEEIIELPPPENGSEPPPENETDNGTGNGTGNGTVNDSGDEPPNGTGNGTGNGTETTPSNGTRERRLPLLPRSTLGWLDGGLLDWLGLGLDEPTRAQPDGEPSEVAWKFPSSQLRSQFACAERD